MKYKRSTKCSLKFTNQGKINELDKILPEYARVVNIFIEIFWSETLQKKDLLKAVLHKVDSWFTERMKKVAAREALDMISAAKAKALEAEEEPVIPVHYGKSMSLSSTIVTMNKSKSPSGEFDYWLHLASIGHNIIINLPIKLHKHFHELAKTGRLLASYIIHKNYVQLCFEFKTDPKKSSGALIGLDTGIKHLASLSNGEMLGNDVEKLITRINRRKRGSKGRKRAQRALRQYIDETAKQVSSMPNLRLLVVENLKGLNKQTKKRRRLSKNMRRVIGIWPYRYWLLRLQQGSERECFSFRSVSPAYTSTTCRICGYSDKRNRKGEAFYCLDCDHQEHADTHAAKKVLFRFLDGPYGAVFKCESI